MNLDEIKTGLLALAHRCGASRDTQPDAEAATQTGAASTDSGVQAPATPDLSADLAAKDAEIAAARAQLAEARESGYRIAAEAFAETLQATHTPYQSGLLVANLVQAMRDDAFSPLAEGSRVESVKASAKAKEAHGLLGEAVQATVLPAGGASETNGMSEERRKALLAASPLGQTALRANGGNK